jgi:CBS domain-containing protein
MSQSLNFTLPHNFNQQKKALSYLWSVPKLQQMNNVIPTRIYGFLKEYPPFSMLTKEELLELSENVIVKYVQPGSVIFKQDSPIEPYIYIVVNGAIHLVREEDDEAVLVDECDEGDVFGVRPLLAGTSYGLTAKAEEETLLYALQIEGITPFLQRYPQMGWYFAKSFASGTRNPEAETDKGRIFLEQNQFMDGPYKLVEIQSIEHSKKPVTCTPTTTVQEAAQIMRQQRVGSIIVVNQASHPVGILTDRDLRNKVVTGEFGLETQVSAIMSQPVVTIHPQLTVADVQIFMMKYGIHHLCLTEDGSPNSKVVGIISEHDLLVIQGNNPAIFIREIRRCESGKDLRAVRERAEVLLRKYLLQEVSIQFICNMMTEINDALITRAIQICEAEMATEHGPAPKVKWAWLALGSEGREEQLLRTDQDNALVYQDVPQREAEKVKQYFLTLAKKITDLLYLCGFDYCPGDMMASNPKWCLSLTDWKKQFSNWIYEPTGMNILFCNIFFDYRPIYGGKALGEALSQHIFDSSEGYTFFLAMLARDALKQPPPLTFFRNFVVEKGGEHKDEFDIKGRAMMPLADAARVLILEAKQPGITNTFQRFDFLAKKEPQNKELYEQAAEAYEMLVRYRALQGLKNKNSGRYFKPSDLSKMGRLNLRNSFRPIGELQDLLKIRFQLNLI